MAKSRRASVCSFSKNVKQEIYDRDDGRCIFCGTTNQLTYMHFVARSRQGLGIVQNGALGCRLCHTTLDNPIGKKENIKSKEMKLYFTNYLNGFYPTFSDKERKYEKWNLSKK